MKSEKGTEKLFFKYNEDETLAEVMEYIVGTYSEHYGDQNIQIQDVFDQMGISEAFTRGAAMKYLFRFGKKKGEESEGSSQVYSLLLFIISLCI